MHRTTNMIGGDLLTREWSEPASAPAVRINTDSAPRGTSETSYPEQEHSGGSADLHSARINTDSAPRGVSKSEVGSMAHGG
jgi:hypothetical protein